MAFLFCCGGKIVYQQAWKDNMKTISVVTPCFNEENNVEPLVQRVRAVFQEIPEYDYEHILADNCSSDNTLSILRGLAKKDKHIKIICNARNFGYHRSQFNAILSASGDAVILLAADMQDPPEMLPEFIKKWEEGFQVVFGIRGMRYESVFLQTARKLYYRLLNKISEDELINDAGDFVLFDKNVLNILKQIKDSSPYLRGMFASLGFSIAGIEYRMEQRHSGKSSNNFFGLMVHSLLGFINHTMLPLRLATFIGFGLAIMSLFMSFLYLLLKIVLWDAAPPGIATLIIGLFFFSGVQVFLLGFIGEMVGAILRQSKNYPIVVEKERINFE